MKSRFLKAVKVSSGPAPVLVFGVINSHLLLRTFKDMGCVQMHPLVPNPLVPNPSTTVRVYREGFSATTQLLPIVT